MGEWVVTLDELAIHWTDKPINQDCVVVLLSASSFSSAGPNRTGLLDAEIVANHAGKC